VYQIFPARATPSIAPTDPGYIIALLYHMALPLITIVLIGFGSWAYLVRNFMVGIMQEDFISAKKTMGITKKKIVYLHALKNAAPPIVTILALSLSGSLGGAIISFLSHPNMPQVHNGLVSGRTTACHHHPARSTNIQLIRVSGKFIPLKTFQSVIS